MPSRATPRPARATALRAAVLALAGTCVALPAAAAGRPAAHPAPASHPAPAARPALRPVVATATAPTYAERAEVRAFARELAARHPELDADWIAATLAQARHVSAATRLIMPAATPGARNWALYRERMVDEPRIAGGVAFWARHGDVLARAEQRYGVPAPLIVAILGIESRYGRVTGTFRALDTLATLAFDFPTGRSDRSGFFRDELAELLLLAHAGGTEPTALRSSYAGAMGMPQFMPSTWRRLAVDFDGDGRIDLHDGVADVIGSVAHYLAAYGWQPGMPTHYAVTPPADAAQRERLLAPDIVPSFSAAEFAQAGAQLDEAGQRHAGPMALVALRNGDAAPTLVAGTENFWVVTRYNWSSYYAMAVIELAQAIAARCAGPATIAPPCCNSRTSACTAAPSSSSTAPPSR